MHIDFLQAAPPPAPEQAPQPGQSHQTTFWEDTREFLNGDGFRDLPRYLAVERRELSEWPGYWIYEDGRVWSDKKRGKFLSPNKDTSGYRQILLCEKERQKTALVHRLVAEAFIVKPDGKDFVNHKDCVKGNNAKSNLEWVTRAENNQHALENGLQANKKMLRTKTLFGIQKDLSEGILSQSAISKKYGTSNKTVWKIKTGRRNSEQRDEVMAAAKGFFAKGMSVKDVSAETGVPMATLYLLKRGKIWSDIKAEGISDTSPLQTECAL